MAFTQNKHYELYGHIEGAYSVGARAALEIKDKMGYDINVGTMQLLKVSGDWNISTNEWDYSITFPGKDGVIVFNQGISLAFAADWLGLPVGIGVGGSVEYNYDTKEKEVTSRTVAVQGGVSYGPVNVNVTRESTVKKDEGSSTTYKASVGNGASAGVILVREYNVEVGIRTK